jgi:heptosyltransferase-2
VWGELGLRSDGRVVALHAGGAYGEAKRWPSDHCAQLARLIAQQLDHDVLVLCGPRERRTARNIALEARHQRVFSLASHALGLGLTKAVLRRCRLAVCTDSGPRHLAAAFGKPVVTLFGPTLPIWVENPTVHSVNLCRELDCLGCGRRACPLGHHRCMNELSPQQVFAAVASLLDTDERRRRIAG